MRISNRREYREAIDLRNRLKEAGETAESHAELAELEGAISAYEALADQPDESKGKPASRRTGDGA